MDGEVVFVGEPRGRDGHMVTTAVAATWEGEL